MDMSLAITGTKEIYNSFHAVASIPDSEKLLDAFLKDAIVLRGRIRSAAAKGPAKKNEQMRLRKGIIAKKYKRQSPNNPTVFVAIDYKKAPHATWVEYGARGVGKPAIAGTFRGRASGKKALLVNSFGMSRWYTKTVPGPMPASHFFSRTVDRNRTDIQNRLEKSSWDLINQKWLAYT